MQWETLKRRKDHTTRGDKREQKKEGGEAGKMKEEGKREGGERKKFFNSGEKEEKNGTHHTPEPHKLCPGNTARTTLLTAPKNATERRWTRK